ncbi:Uncharacterized protein TPAR_03805 [Tolypocladium paradoxum]|uniref:NAD-dependent epimerase/dehydratase domain-containing protein n=1 Tax=Tolypocladium paradoxum TaxID=94208 RepID=A0A2S4L0M0_9HYPO|nr:Uncharacterized protein TPAR_03805 [Tolypocladium paradoxum]
MASNNNNNKGLVLLTGATGHVGFAVLLKALEQGYKVRVVLRDMGKEDLIRSSDAVKRALSSVDDTPQLSFVSVPDVTLPGAFDSAMKDITYVVHVASPIPRGASKDPQAELIDPAVKGTANVLHSAREAASVRRVVITSSTSAIVNYHFPPAPGTRVAPSDRQPDYHFPDVAACSGNEAYSAAKTAALNATDAFLLAGGDLHFDVVNIMPTYVFGPKGLATSPEAVISGSNIFGIGLALVKQPWGSVCIESVSCHVDDVAEAHVQALSHDESGRLPLRVGTHRDFILAVPFKPEEVREIVAKTFPKELWEDGEAAFGGTGTYEWYHTEFEVSATEGLLGHKLKGLEEQICASGAQVLRIVEASQGHG